MLTFAAPNLLSAVYLTHKLGDALETNHPNRATESDTPEIRAALLLDFYNHHETRFAQIWKMVRGGSDRSLVGALLRDDLALRIDDIITPARRRYDAKAFQEHQKERKSNDAPVLSANSYFDAVRQGIQAAQDATRNLDIFITSMMTLDHRHIGQVLRLVGVQAAISKVPLSEEGFTEFLDTIKKTQWVVNACYAAMVLATCQSVKKRGKGKPPSIYTPLAMELGELWEELTGKPIPTPKHSKKSNDESRHESSQTSTQFVWLAMQMAVPNIKLRQAETALRNAIPVLRFRNEELTDPRKHADLWRELLVVPTMSPLFKYLGDEENWTESDD